MDRKIGKPIPDHKGGDRRLTLNNCALSLTIIKSKHCRHILSWHRADHLAPTGFCFNQNKHFQKRLYWDTHSVEFTHELNSAQYVKHYTDTTIFLFFEALSRVSHHRLPVERSLPHWSTSVCNTKHATIHCRQHWMYAGVLPKRQVVLCFYL